MQRKSGFTLIEITLVMVIACLLLPLYPGAGALSIRWLIEEQSGCDVAAQSARRQSLRTGEPWIC